MRDGLDADDVFGTVQHHPGDPSHHRVVHFDFRFHHGLHYQMAAFAGQDLRRRSPFRYYGIIDEFGVSRRDLRGSKIQVQLTFHLHGRQHPCSD